jgi:hypothetical protein
MSIPTGIIFSHEELDRLAEVGETISRQMRRGAESVVWAPVKRGLPRRDETTAADRQQRALENDLRRFIEQRSRRVA